MYGLPGEPQFYQPLMLAQRKRKQRGRLAFVVVVVCWGVVAGAVLGRVAGWW